MVNVDYTDEQLKCAGCGIGLQTEDEAGAGYIPARTLERKPPVCQRCFRIKNYNEVSSNTVSKDDFLSMLSHIARTESLVAHIVDIFDFEGSLISGLQRFVGDNPILLVVNKIDLLPKGTNPNKILNWIRKQAKSEGLKVLDVVLCSAKQGAGFERVIASLQQYRGDRDVYVVGATNVGKSTLINRLIRDYSDLNAELTTSRYPGTTLDLVKIPLDDGKSIIDTPGIVYDFRLTELISKEELQILMPEKPVKPRVYQLNEGQTLFFGALARFDFVRGERQSFTCYIANSLDIHRTKLENADGLYESHRGGMLAPPSPEHLAELPPLTKHSFSIKRGGRKDVLISGLGWIQINSDAGAQVVVHAPKGVRVAVRDALI